MATAFLTIILVLAIIGSIVFDRVYVQHRKSDAVFGNPERANGGFHWIIAGSCSILLLWLYFSWDIARSFYPQSANELCQIAKVRDSVLGINYIFPIEQRTLKSTAFIEREKKIIRNLKKDLLVSSIEKSTIEKQSFARYFILISLIAISPLWFWYGDKIVLNTLIFVWFLVIIRRIFIGLVRLDNQ